MAKITQDLNIDTRVNQDIAAVTKRIPQTSSDLKKSESFKRFANLSPVVGDALKTIINYGIQDLTNKKSKAIKYLENGIPEEEVKRIGDDDTVNFYLKAKTVSDVSEQHLKEVNNGVYNAFSEDEVNQELRNKIYDTYQNNHGEISDNDLLYINQVSGAYKQNIDKAYYNNKSKYDQYKTNSSLQSELLIKIRGMSKNTDITPQQIYNQLFSKNAKNEVAELLGNNIEQSSYNAAIIKSMQAAGMEDNLNDKILQASQIPYSTGRFEDIDPDTGQVVNEEVRDRSSFYGTYSSDVQTIFSMSQTKAKVKASTEVLHAQEQFKKEYLQLTEQEYEEYKAALFEPYATSEAKRRDIIQMDIRRDEHKEKVKEVNFSTNYLISGDDEYLNAVGGVESFNAKDREFKQEVTDNAFNNHPAYSEDPSTWTTDLISTAVHLQRRSGTLPTEVKQYLSHVNPSNNSFKTQVGIYNLFREDGYSNTKLENIFDNKAIAEIKRYQALTSTMNEMEAMDIISKTSVDEVGIIYDSLPTNSQEMIDNFDINNLRGLNNKVNQATANSINNQIKDAIKYRLVQVKDGTITVEEIHDDVVKEYNDTNLIYFGGGILSGGKDAIIATPAMVNNEELVKYNVENISKFISDIGDHINVNYDDITIKSAGPFSSNNTDDPLFQLVDSDGIPLQFDPEFTEQTGITGYITQSELLNPTFNDTLNMQRVDAKKILERKTHSINDFVLEEIFDLDKLVNNNLYASDDITYLASKINNGNYNADDLFRFMEYSDRYPINKTNSDEIQNALELANSNDAQKVLQGAFQTVESENNNSLEQIETIFNDLVFEEMDAQNQLEPVTQRVVQFEGGFQNNENDTGNFVNGENIGTNFGITPQALADYRGVDVSTITTEDIQGLTPQESGQLLEQEYYVKPRINELDSNISELMYNMSVLSGPGRAVRILQETADVNKDGIVGPETIGASTNVTREQLAENYLEFLQGLSNWNKFGEGWTNRINSILEQ